MNPFFRSWRQLWSRLGIDPHRAQEHTDSCRVKNHFLTPNVTPTKGEQHWPRSPSLVIEAKRPWQLLRTHKPEQGAQLGLHLLWTVALGYGSPFVTGTSFMCPMLQRKGQYSRHQSMEQRKVYWLCRPKQRRQGYVMAFANLSLLNIIIRVRSFPPPHLLSGSTLPVITSGHLHLTGQLTSHSQNWTHVFP